MSLVISAFVSAAHKKMLSVFAQALAGTSDTLVSNWRAAAPQTELIYGVRSC